MSWCGGGEMRPTPGVVNRGLGNPRINLAARQFAAFARLRALRHFDLQLLRVDEVMARHAEPADCDLLDGGILRIAVRQRNVTLRVFAAFAGVGFAAEAVHRDGERLVRFLAKSSRSSSRRS